MANFKEELKDAVISEEARKNLTPDQLADLERLLKELRENELPTSDIKSKKFDAKDMRPEKQDGPVRWRLIGDPPPVKKK
jgi:hypothetical protein